MNYLMYPSVRLFFVLGFYVSLVTSCEKDFSDIGTDVIGNQNITIQSATYPVKTYNKRITPFQTNALAKNLLGYYYDPNFGSTTVHFLTQLTPKNYSPNFGDNTVLDSVVLTIPYSSRKQDDVYSIDSLYGQTPIKLSIFKNNFLLRDFDPGSDLEATQSYYSNGSLSPTEALNSAELEGQLLYQNTSFLPSNDPIPLTTTNSEGETETTATLTPSLRVKFDPNDLPNNFWEELIFDKEDDDELSSANNFYNYFRGLYFKVEPLSPEASDGTFIQLDFVSANAHLKLHYTYEVTSTTTDETSERQGSYDLGFNGKRVNVFENNFDPAVLQNIANSNPLEGDAQLYLKGGEGAMAIVELFSEDESGNDFDDYITDFKENDGDETIVKRLINEAYLEFYIDETAMATNSDVPNRVFVFDLNNKIPLADYYFDSSVNSKTSDSKFAHLVPVSTETNDAGIEQRKYKIRLTGHLNNIVTKDSTNVKIGLLVSSNVGATDMKTFLTYDNQVNGIPTGSILSPKSVILHGNNSSDVTKKVKLNIYYTDSEN
jgi:hypothetical protein